MIDPYEVTFVKSATFDAQKVIDYAGTITSLLDHYGMKHRVEIEVDWETVRLRVVRIGAGAVLAGKS